MDKEDLVRSTRARGSVYERLAEEYLVNRGYELLYRNFRYKKGEIDLILEKDKVLVFVEVKFRVNEDFGKPYEFISRRQKLNIINTAVYFTRLNKQYKDYTFRFDVITFTGDSDTPEYYPNAFSIDEFKFIKAL